MFFSKTPINMKIKILCLSPHSMSLSPHVASGDNVGQMWRLATMLDNADLKHHINKINLIFNCNSEEIHSRVIRNTKFFIGGHT